jgi:hypothetical protein
MYRDITGEKFLEIYFIFIVWSACELSVNSIN